MCLNDFKDNVMNDYQQILSFIEDKDRDGVSKLAISFYAIVAYMVYEIEEYYRNLLDI